MEKFCVFFLRSPCESCPKHQPSTMISTTLDPHAQIESRKKKSLFEGYICYVLYVFHVLSNHLKPIKVFEGGICIDMHIHDIHITMYTYIHRTHIDKTLLYCMCFVSRLFDPCIHLDVHVPKSHLFGTLTG